MSHTTLFEEPCKSVAFPLWLKSFRAWSVEPCLFLINCLQFQASACLAVETEHPLSQCVFGSMFSEWRWTVFGARFVFHHHPFHLYISHEVAEWPGELIEKFAWYDWFWVICFLRWILVPWCCFTQLKYHHSVRILSNHLASIFCSFYFKCTILILKLYDCNFLLARKHVYFVWNHKSEAYPFHNDKLIFLCLGI